MSKIQRIALKSIAFAIATMAMIAAGTLFSFDAYEMALKSDYNLTQAQAEVLFSAGYLGLCVGFPAGFLYDKFGAITLNLIGMFVPSTAYLVLWSTTLMPQFYHEQWWLLVLFYFWAGHGAIYLYMVALLTSVRNLPRVHRGKIIGFLGAMYYLSPGVFSIVYAKDNWTTALSLSHLPIGNFWLVLAATFGIVGLLAVAGLREYRRTAEDARVRPEPSLVWEDVADLTSRAFEYPQSEEDFGSICESDQELDPADDAIPVVGTRPRLRVIRDEKGCIQPRAARIWNHSNVAGWDLLKRWDFYFLLLPYVFLSGSCLTLIANIESILCALNLDQYTAECIQLLAISSAVSRFFIGLISDRFRAEIPRSNILLVVNLTFLASLIASCVCASEFALIAFLCVVAGVMLGTVGCLAPTIISERFGVENFGGNWGGMLLAGGLGTLVIGAIFGIIYDRYVIDFVGVCEGVHCFRWSFMFLAGLALCSLIFLLGLVETNN